MYDYVLQFGFDRESQIKIQKIRNYLRQNEMLDKQRGWHPHITIDLYNFDDVDNVVKMIDKLVKNIPSFDIDLLSLDNFKKETLFIKPTPQDNLSQIKEKFDNLLDEYRLESKKDQIYQPHVTLCTNYTFERSQELVLQVFQPFKATVTKIWMYDERMHLIKEWVL